MLIVHLITGFDLHTYAVERITHFALSGTHTEAGLRRAISGLYYGLFHHLTEASVACFHAGGAALQQQAARAFNHSTMRKVCESYSRATSKPLAPPLDALHSSGPDRRLINVAQEFAQLQEARHKVDYDMATSISLDDALQARKSAIEAHTNFEMVRDQPGTIVFLTALLLTDRWTRRG